MSKAFIQPCLLLQKSWSHQKPRNRVSMSANQGGDIVASKTSVYKVEGHLKRGMQVSYGGDVIVFGNVEPGAEIQAGGDVTIWGRIEGKVQAGYPARAGAVIRSLSVMPDAGKIGGCFGPIHGKDSCSELVVDDDGINLIVREPLGSKLPNHLVDSRHGSRIIKTALFTGTYAVLLGLGLMMFPKFIYGLLFDVTRVSLGLIRLGGSLLALVGMQYLGTALSDRALGTTTKGFYSSTVFSRVFLVTFVAFLVGVRSLEWTWLVFAALNGAGAISMIIAISKDFDSKRQQ